jgi:hypothetical protein
MSEIKEEDLEINGLLEVFNALLILHNKGGFSVSSLGRDSDYKIEYRKGDRVLSDVICFESDIRDNDTDKLINFLDEFESTAMNIK